MKLNLAIIGSLAALFAFGAYAATVGDKAPAGKYGLVQCPADGGVTLLPLLPNQNAMSVRNFIGDGGTGATVYLGFDSKVTTRTGFPVKDQEVLSIDIVAQSEAASITAPANIDGGVTVTLGVMVPTIYCTAGTTGGAQDLRFIMVK